MFKNNDKQSVIDSISTKYAEREDVTSKDIEECYEQVVSLKESGKLFAPDTFEPVAGHLKAKTSGVIKALCVIQLLNPLDTETPCATTWSIAV